MLIRCPECSFTRQVNDSKVPAGSEHATCPRCKKRFRFRALSPEEIALSQQERAKQDPRTGAEGRAEPVDFSGVMQDAAEDASPAHSRTAQPGEDGEEASSRKLGPDEDKPEENGEDDVWSAVEKLNKHWEDNYDSRHGATPGPDGGAAGHSEDSFGLDSERHQLNKPGVEEERNKFFSAPDSDDDFRDISEEEFGDRTFLHGKDEPEQEIPEAYDRHGAPKYHDQRDSRNDPAESAGFSGSGRPSFLADSGSVPWEYRGGFLNPQALVRTILLSFTRIPEFFGGMPARGSLLPAMVFALLMRGLQFVVTFVFLKFDFITPEGERINTSLADMAQISIPELVITTVFIVILLQFASSWIVNFMVRLVSGRSSFSLTFRVVSYSLAPLIFVLIPQLGLMIGEIGSLTLFTIGLRHAYRLSWQKTMMVMIPLMLLMFLINLSTLRVFAG